MTHILYPPFAALGDTYNMLLDQALKEGDFKPHPDALQMLAFHLEATAADLRNLAKVAAKHPLTISGDENILLVNGPADILNSIKLEDCNLTPFNPLKSGVIVTETIDADP